MSTLQPSHNSDFKSALNDLLKTGTQPSSGIQTPAASPRKALSTEAPKTPASAQGISAQGPVQAAPTRILLKNIQRPT